MERKYVRFMTYGKNVKVAEKVFVLIENATPTKDMVKVVASEHAKRYQLLCKWCENWDHDFRFRARFHLDIQKVRREKETYVIEIPIDCMEAIDQIRFIDPTYKTLFHVKNFGQIKIGDETYIVSHIDDYHFYLLDPNEESAYERCFHICQFAEICDRNHLTVEPVNGGGLR